MRLALLYHSRRSDGQGLSEYALVLGLIAVVAIVGLVFMGTAVTTLLSEISTVL